MFYLNVKFKIFVHLINIAEYVTNNSRNDALQVSISKNSLKQFTITAIKYMQKFCWASAETNYHLETNAQVVILSFV